MKGILYVIGLGPGDREQMTEQAKKALKECDVIAGYTVYVDLIRADYPDKEILSTPMTKEEQRCRLALERCETGQRVAMVCSGDPGVYGMAGLIFQLAPEYPNTEIRVIPGITAACAGGAVLGAPLMHDFAVISLSDRLTPIDTIWKRLRLAAQGDFVICLYNPASKSRKDYLKLACQELLAWRPADTVCGVVRSIGRQGEEYQILSLEQLKDYPADMFTTVFIGNSQTQALNGRMVTPRGYRLERPGQ